MAVSPATYERLALEDPDSKWELVCGRPRRKPPMTSAHNSLNRWLHFELQRQLPFIEFEVSQESARVRLRNGNHYVPDLAVLPHRLVVPRLADRSLEAYLEPLPLIVEVWSKSTGEYDVEEKLVEYRLRGDLEIWRIHPYEKTLTAWIRNPDGSYVERLHRTGSISCAALPNVTVDLDALFGLL